MKLKLKRVMTTPRSSKNGNVFVLPPVVFSTIDGEPTVPSPPPKMTTKSGSPPPSSPKRSKKPASNSTAQQRPATKKKRQPTAKKTASQQKQLSSSGYFTSPDEVLSSLPPPSLPSPRDPSLSPDRAKMMLTPDQLSHIQRYILVIDLDATFVSSKTEMSSFPRAKKAIEACEDAAKKQSALDRLFVFSLGKSKMWTILRPGATEFISFASFYFKQVLVWSAGQADYVEEIVSLLFPPHVPRPSVVFSWDDCRVERRMSARASERDSASPSNTTDLMFSKPLTEILPHVIDDQDHTKTKTRELMSKILILDDRSDIAEYNMENLVKIPPFEPKLTTSELTKDDVCLEKFTRWLLKLDTMTANDIRKVGKGGIFS